MATVDKAFRIKNGLVVEGSTATVAGNTILTETTGDAYILDLIGGETLISSVDAATFTVDVNGNLTVNEEVFDEYGAASAAGNNANSHTNTVLELYTQTEFLDQPISDLGYIKLGDLDTHTEASSGVHGVNGDVVGTSDTQDISNKRVIDTLYFTDGVTVANEGEIAVKPTTHQFEIKANYGNLDLKTVAAGANVAISASDGDIVLDAGSVSISATEPSVEIIALARAGSTQDILVFAYVPSYPEVFFDTVNTGTGLVEIGIISSEVVGDEYIVTAGATGVLFVVGQSYIINTYSPNSSWSFDSNGTLYGPAMGGVKVTTLFTDSIASIEDNNLYFASNSNIILNADVDSYLGSVSTGNQIATQGYVDSAISTEVTDRNNAITTAVDNLVDGAPGLLDTLNEIAAAIADDENYSTTMTTALAAKAPLASPVLTGVPEAPTAAADTNTNQIATTAFAKAEADAAELSASNYTNLEIIDALNTAQGYANTAESEANSYTDGRETAITTAYQTYADGLVDDIKDGTTTFTQITLTDALIGTATTSLSTTSATVVDSWSATNYSSAKYLVQMKNGTDIEVLEVLVTVDGNNNVYITEYADVISNAQIGTTDADLFSGNVRLLVTSTSGTTIKVHKTLIEA